MAAPKDAHHPLTDLRNLLTTLPRWDDERVRHAIAEQALGKGHRVLAEMDWEGSPRDVAWNLVSLCDDFDNLPAGPGRDQSPLCALLAEARERCVESAPLAQRIADLGARLGCRGPAPAVDWPHHPYPGMAAFNHVQAPIFFGREAETRALLAKLQGPQGQRLLLVAGRSGSGKSSLVRAGLWAALHDAARTPIPGSESWVISAMKPNGGSLADPFLALAFGLHQAEPRLPDLGEADREAESLRTDPDGFAALLGRVLDGRPDAAEWLLIIDQFEELFTSVPEARRDAFLDRLLSALALPRLRVVATVRSDFLDACAAHAGLRAELNTDGSQYYVDAPDARDLYDMITGPVRKRVLAPERRLSLDDDLVNQLVRDASGQPGGLAVLAFALKDLYDECHAGLKDGRRQEARIGLADYRQPNLVVTGTDPAATPILSPAPSGLDRFIRDRAEKAVGRAGVAAESVLPRVFSRLLSVQTDGAATRQREHLGHWDQDPEARRLIAELSREDCRLLVCGEAQEHALEATGATRRGRIVEVAHEALFRAWPALADWIGRYKEALIRRPQVEHEAALWHAQGRPDERIPNTYVATETRKLLDEAELWAPLAKDRPAVAHFLVRDDPEELAALTQRAWQESQGHGGADQRMHLLHTLTRFERGSATLSGLVERLRAQDTERGTDLVGWLRAGIDSESLFAAPDAARWSWHRVAIGDLLDALGDDREGVGLDAAGLPAIAWHPVPAGPFPWQDGDQEGHTGPFRIARYPITNRQYRAFTAAPDYRDPQWWPRGVEEPYEHLWAAGNRPRVALTWGEALAFCRWLTERLRARGPAAGGLAADEVIRLPTEAEWEKAARGTERRAFPWAGDYWSGAANVDETYDGSGPLYLRQTVAVGLYPRNRSPYGLMDCAGNVWEWCLNRPDDEYDTDVEADGQRGVRGGSWDLLPAAARVSVRSRDVIGSRGVTLGFRVCCAGPIAGR
jgi:hypothetical protein